jgi:monoamine oxidase
MTVPRDAIVVGAGLSGLAAAVLLAGRGLDVLVLEARERIGGRVWRVPAGEATFEAGGEVLGHEHHPLVGLARDVGLRVVEGPGWDGETAADLERRDLELFRELEAKMHRLAASLDPEHPEELEDAGRMDRQTLAGWLEERDVSRDVLDAAETSIAIASSAVSTREMSLLAYPAKIAAGAAPTGLRLRIGGGPERARASARGRTRGTGAARRRPCGARGDFVAFGGAEPTAAARAGTSSRSAAQSPPQQLAPIGRRSNGLGGRT